MRKKQLLSVLAEAWEMMLDYPLPRFLQSGTSGRPSATAVLLAIPFVGLFCGALPVIAAKITGTFLPPFGNAVLFAALMTVLMLTMDSGRGFRLLPELVRTLLSGGKLSASLPILAPRKLTEINDLGSTLCAFLTLGSWLTGFAYLGYAGAMMWAVPVMLMGTMAQAHLLSLRNLRGGLPFLAITERDRNKLWVVAVFLMLFPAIAHPLAVLVTFGVCGGFALAARHYAEELYGGITAEMITLAGFAAELAALLCGVLLIR